jgi:hypothetical protein
MMMPQRRVTRRRFLGITAAMTGAMLVPGEVGLGADAAAAGSIAGETEHFWYRAQPAGKYIDSQRDNKAFAYADGKIFLSEDNGHTWPHSIEFPDAPSITFSHILKNGNVLFATGAKLYLSTDNLKTYQPITVKALDGSYSEST